MCYGTTYYWDCCGNCREVQYFDRCAAPGTEFCRMRGQRKASKGPCRSCARIQARRFRAELQIQANARREAFEREFGADKPLPFRLDPPLPVQPDYREDNRQGVRLRRHREVSTRERIARSRRNQLMQLELMCQERFITQMLQADIEERVRLVENGPEEITMLTPQNQNRLMLSLLEEITDPDSNNAENERQQQQQLGRLLFDVICTPSEAMVELVDMMEDQARQREEADQEEQIPTEHAPAEHAPAEQGPQEAPV